MSPRLRDAIERAWESAARFDEPTLARLREQAAGCRGRTAIRPVAEALSHDHLSLIVEPKRRADHVSSGDESFDLERVARESAMGGADVLVIVTEPMLAAGRVDDVPRARGACELPILARDFAVHEGHVLELYCSGADGLLLPVAAFIDADDEHEGAMAGIVEAATRLGMDVIPSVRDVGELAFALAYEIDVINIDNRDMDGDIDVDRTLDLLAEVPVGTLVISESIEDVEEVEHLHRAGVDALLLDEGHVEGDLPAALAYYRSLIPSD